MNKKVIDLKKFKVSNKNELFKKKKNRSFEIMLKY